MCRTCVISCHYALPITTFPPCRPSIPHPAVSGWLHRYTGINQVGLYCTLLSTMETEMRLQNSSTTDEDTNSEESTETRKKEQWGSKVDFFLSILGMVVGFGNVWRFPYVCMKNGGGAFLFPYLITIFLLAIPVYSMEAALGQFSGKTMRNVWCFCPIIQGAGMGLLLLMGICVWYYIMLTTWVVYYLYQSFQSPLPWSTCGNPWNTPDCFSFRESESTHALDNSTMGNSSDTYNITAMGSRNRTVNGFKEGHSSEEEFWQYNVLDISSGIENFGSINGHLAVCLLISWIVVYLCVIKGIRSSGKVVYVTATLPYILLTVILVRSLTLPGAIDGIIFFLKPDFPSLLNLQVWLQAAIQVFYSMGIGWGVHITLSSFNKFDNNCYRDAYLLTLAGEGTSLFAGFVIFSALGFMAHKAGLPVGDVVKSGPGLGFIAYPQALSQMPYPNVWTVLFFLALFTVGLDSQFAFVETVCVYIEESFPRLGKRRVLFRAAFAGTGFLSSLVFCTKGGVYLFQLIDWYCAAFAPTLFTLLTCIAVGWVYGAGRFSRDIEMMLGRGIPVYIRICWCFLSPLLAFVLLAANVVSYVPPTYGDYIYPGYASGIGWLFASLSVVPVIVVGVDTVRKAPGNTVYKKFLYSLKPTKEWGPACKGKAYAVNENDIKITFADKLLNNIGYKSDFV